MIDFPNSVRTRRALYKRVLLYAVTFLFLQLLAAQEAAIEPFVSGDLLFQDLDCGPMCEAIERVTDGWEGRSFSHIGLVVTRGDSLMVLEAIGEGVGLTALDGFLSRSRTGAGNPKIVVGRLKQEYSGLIPGAIDYALRQLGVPYDDDFLYGNGKYYCSELIYDAFKSANGDVPFFELQPMTFNDPMTGKPFSVWDEYFKGKEMPIPEGKPGCNPGGLSKDSKLEMVHVLF